MSSQPTSWSADLDARYELLAEAGRGGMGVVYKARDRETSEIVAVKILKPDIAADRVSAERFINEVRLSRRITHKNVCRVYEFTRAGGSAYLSMEYVEGESLRTVLERMGSVTLRKGMQIARQICAALDEAHSQGIVHRDLKPENVMLDRAGNVKVMDFGIARVLDSSVTSTGGIVGTPAYMAPEQAEGREIDARTDIYAAGLILYELFTGRPTFSGDTPVTVALKQIRETPTAPRAHDPSIPVELDAAILKCLEKDPARRFQSIADLDATLARVPSTDTGAPPSAQPTVEKVNPAPPIDARRRRIQVVAAAAVVALAVAGAYFAFWRTTDPFPFTTFTLANGLRVVLSEDHSAPTVAVSVAYKVGSRDDPPGRAGMAHLFEHMMVGGSLNVGTAEHVALIGLQGGVANMQTYADHTQFWQTLPSNQLDLALFLEADRMRSLRLDDARLRTERATVANERSERYDNVAYGRVRDALYRAAYDVPGYKHDIVGTAADLEQTSLQEINDFFRVFYAPNNAVLTVVGDFAPPHARGRIEHYFQHLPAQPPAPAPDLSSPPQTAPRRVALEDPFAPAARYFIGYKTPPGSADEWPAIRVLATILADGASSRLHKKLVKEMEAASLVSGGVEQRAGPGIALFAVEPAPDRDEPAIVKAFDDAVAQVREQGVTAAEVERARNRLRLADATAQQQTWQRANLLGRYATSFGGAAGANVHARRLDEITPDAVRRVAAAYFDKPLQTLVAVVPAAVRSRAPAPAAPRVTSAVERLNRAPISKDVVRVSLPKAKEVALDNGLTLLVARDARAPLVSVRFAIRGAGPLHDPPDSPGTAMAVAAMLRQGTRTRSAQDIAEQLDHFGATVAATPGQDRSVTLVNATGLSETFERWFPLVADMVANASTPADELSLMKRQLAANLRTQLSSGATLATLLFDESVYGVEAARQPTAESLARLTSDGLQAWRREHYAPQNTILTVTGAIDEGAAENAVRAALGAWARSPYSEALPSMPAPAPRRALVLDRPGSVQTSVVIGAPAVDRVHADYLPLVVANQVLGGTVVSRLFVKLREERGLSFAPFSSLSAFKQGGDWRVYGDVNAGRDSEALDLFLDEVRRIATERVPDAELDAAKRAMVAGFAVTLEQLVQRVGYLSSRRSYGLSTDYWDRYPERIMAITADDVQRAAGKYFDPSRLQIVAVGDAAKLESLLSARAPVTKR